MDIKKLVCLIFGFIFLILGILGVILPVMPGVIFLVASAYFFDRSSKAMHQKLLSIPHLGARIKAWEQERVMSITSKLSIIFFCLTTIFMTHFWAKWNLGVMLICDLILIQAIFWAIAQPSQREKN